MNVDRSLQFGSTVLDSTALAVSSPYMPPANERWRAAEASVVTVHTRSADRAIAGRAVPITGATSGGGFGSEALQHL